jgi:predicted metal-dependent phosphoesterase TrpH
MAIDLHLHTNASDGTLSPEALMTTAAKLNLTAVSITDHDSTDSLATGATLAAKFAVGFIPGVEVSASYTPDLSIHILGYGVDPQHPMLRQVLAQNQRAWDQSENDSIAALERLAIKIDPARYNYWKTHSEAGGWPLFNTLKEMGLVSTVNEYFGKYFGQGKPAYITISFASPEEVIKSIKAAGGVPVLAHPVLYEEDNLKLISKPAFQRTLLAWGLEGMEAIAHCHTTAETADLISFCQENNLLITGGSDYHGEFAGRQLGTPVVDDAYLPPLLKAINRRQHATRP